MHQDLSELGSHHRDIVVNVCIGFPGNGGNQHMQSQCYCAGMRFQLIKALHRLISQLLNLICDPFHRSINPADHQSSDNDDRADDGRDIASFLMNPSRRHHHPRAALIPGQNGDGTDGYVGFWILQITRI